VISVNDDRRLQAAVLAMKRLDRDLKRDIATATRTTLNPVWKGLVQRHATGTAARVLVPGTRIAAGNPPRAVAASSTRAIGRSRRLKPAEHWQAWEFGASDHDGYSTYTRRSSKGKRSQVRRRTMTGLPRRTRQGRVVYPAFAELGPRAVELWLQIIVRKTRDAAEGK